MILGVVLISCSTRIEIRIHPFEQPYTRYIPLSRDIGGSGCTPCHNASNPAAPAFEVLGHYRAFGGSLGFRVGLGYIRLRVWVFWV